MPDCYSNRRTQMKKLSSAWLIMFWFAATSARTGAAQEPGTGKAPPVTLPNTERHVLRSKVNGRAYLVDVVLPLGYGTHKPGDETRYPTLYLLDGAWEFPLFFSRVAEHQAIGTILVGVSAADGQGLRRQTDYTLPLTAADSQYFKDRPLLPHATFGGAPQFLRILKEEIIPLIDRSYPTSGDRGIEGASLGGLFVAYAMLEEPDLFTRYALVSPSLWYPWGREQGIVLSREPEFAKQHPTFAKTVYLSVGSEEDPGMIAVSWRFVAQLCTSLSKGYYKGLDLGAEILPGQPHASPAAHVRVLAALYSADSTATKPGRGVMQYCR